MKMIVVSVCDKEIGFARPFFVPSEGAAIRSFTDEVNRPASDNVLYCHPESFCLFRIGTFDDSNGQLSAEPPKPLAAALDIHKGDR